MKRGKVGREMDWLDFSYPESNEDLSCTTTQGLSFKIRYPYRLIETAAQAAAKVGSSSTTNIAGTISDSVTNLKLFRSQ